MFLLTVISGDRILYQSWAYLPTPDYGEEVELPEGRGLVIVRGVTEVTVRLLD